jgi:DNA modification methylase
MILKTEELPDNIQTDSIVEISTNKVNYFTHGFFKYPCKFIPQIPRWAILKYSEPNDYVIDPFAGSGTSVVEAVLNRRNGLAIDFDLLSQLLCETKTTTLTNDQIKFLRQNEEMFYISLDEKPEVLPDIHNLSHWFPEKNIVDLRCLKNNIGKAFEETQDNKIYNFLLVCFASIIKKCSFADDISPKPYVSKRFKKIPLDVKIAFSKTLNSYLTELEAYSSMEIGKCQIISDDARYLSNQQFLGKVKLAVTSPPYINAFDYVRSLRLENAWLGFYGDTGIVDIKKRQIGTESIYKTEYSQFIPLTEITDLDRVINEIGRTDQKRAYIVWKYFIDLEMNLQVINKLLMKNGHYIIVVGDSMIRGVEVPVHQLLVEVAKKTGFELSNRFSYIIKNRYIRIPRSGQGGFIDRDWVLDLRKTNG